MADKEQQQKPQQQTEEEKRMAQVRECGRLAMGIEDVAVVIGLPLREVYADFDERGELYTAYRRGQIETKMELRSARLQEAKSGNLEAGEEIMRLIREINIEQYGNYDDEAEAGDAGSGEGGDAGEHHDH